MIDLRDYGESLDVWFSRIQPLLPDAFVVETRPHHDPMIDDVVFLKHGADSINLYAWTAPGDKLEAVDPFYTGINESNSIGNVRAFVVSHLAVSHESQMPSHGAERPNGSLFTIHEVAARWQVSTDTIRRLIDSGELQCNRIGKQIRFTDEQLNDYVSLQSDGEW